MVIAYLPVASFTLLTSIMPKASRQFYRNCSFYSIQNGSYDPLLLLTWSILIDTQHSKNQTENGGYCCESEVLFSVMHFSHVSTL